MKFKKVLLIIILMLFLMSFSVYIYKGQKKPNSYVLVYPPSSKNEQIMQDVALLKRNKYNFITLSEFKKLIKNKNKIQSKNICLFINKLPSRELNSFLKKENVNVTYNILSNQALQAKKIKLEQVGLRLNFPKTRPIKLKSGYVSLNFDDGYKNVYNIALPILKKAGLAGSVFVIPQTEIDESKTYLSAGQIRRLQSEGWEIGSHSQNHDDFKKINLNDAAFSMTSSKGILEGLSIYETGFAFPYGNYSNNSVLLGKQYYKYLRFSDDGYNLPTNTDVNAFTWENKDNLKWFSSKINRAKNNKVGVVFIIHNISDDVTDYSINPKSFKKAVNIIKNSGLPVFTNQSIFGKPLFLRQEFGNRIENEENYVKRMRFAIKNQRKTLKKSGLESNLLYYPEGVVTVGLIKAAKKEGFPLALGNRVGFLAGKINPLDIKDIIVKPGTVKKLIDY